MSSGHKESEQLFFGWVEKKKKMSTDSFLYKKKSTVDIYFFFMATRFNLIFRNA